MFGADLALRAVVLVRSATLMWNRLRRGTATWVKKRSTHGAVLRHMMKECGFKEAGPYKWDHAAAGRVDLTAVHTEAHKAAMQHRVREAYQRKYWAKWQADKRRAAVLTRHIPYVEKRVRRARM